MRRRSSRERRGSVLGTLAWCATHAQNGSSSGWDSFLGLDCPWERRDRANQQAPQVSEQREEGRGKGRRKRPRVET
jgi:hypothetical protein